MDIKFVQNKANPFRGVKYMNFQASYTLSRFDNAGGVSNTNPGNPAAGDQDFLTSALDFRNPLRFIGPSTLDRTHQLNFGGYADLPLGFRVGMIAHFWSSLPTTPTVPNPGGSTGSIFQTDFTGDGTTQDILPGAHVGSYGRQFGPVGLGKAITAYNTNIAGVTVTPAGQALINQGALLGGGGFTTANLIALGATPPTLPTPVAGQLGLSPLKAFDFTISWVGRFWHERLTLEPKVGFYNIFNFANYDAPGNTMNGFLNGAPGSITNTTFVNRANQIGVGTGVFSLGAPRVTEFSLKLTF